MSDPEELPTTTDPWGSIETKPSALWCTVIASSPSLSSNSTVCPDGVVMTRVVGSSSAAFSGTSFSAHQTPTHSGYCGSPASNSTHTCAPTGGVKNWPGGKQGRAHRGFVPRHTDGTSTCRRPCFLGSLSSTTVPEYLPYQRPRCRSRSSERCAA